MRVFPKKSWSPRLRVALSIRNPFVLIITIAFNYLLLKVRKKMKGVKGAFFYTHFNILAVTNKISKIPAPISAYCSQCLREESPS